MHPGSELNTGTETRAEITAHPVRTTRRTRALLAVILVISGSAITLAMRRTSTTFDEIIMIAGGARGYETGDWSLAREHPPLTQYLYGWLPHLTSPAYAGSNAFALERYTYSGTFFFGAGNDPEKLAFLGRLPAVLCALLIVFLVFRVTRRHYGDGAGLLAAAIVAFLPDILAHGGVAYNDVPVTLTIFAAAWLADAAVRKPSVRTGAAFGLAAGLAVATKNSAVVLAPVALLLVAAEALGRRAERTWSSRVPAAAAAALAAIYVTLVAVYRGDVTLNEYRYAIGFVFGQVTQPDMPGYILGETTIGGRWFYFPVAFLFKTSAGLHLLLLLAVFHLIKVARETEARRTILQSPLRVPIVTLLVLAPLLVTSQLNIGFRYAMPVLPMLAMIAAVGAAGAWRAYGRRARILIAAATAWLIIHPLSFYPNFLSYISEYGPGRDRNYTILVDSSMDWGQGLIQLRDFMRREGIPSVYLSYYGTAWPAAYGIDHVPLPSFLPLPHAQRKSGAEPRHVVISATNLAGAGFLASTDPFRQFRDREPDHVIGNTMFVFTVR